MDFFTFVKLMVKRLATLQKEHILNFMSTTKTFTLTALCMALVIILSSYGLQVPGGHLYLNDIVIVFAGLILPPPFAMIACGIGSFLGDFFFYPTPMFVSLVTHGLQGWIISSLWHKQSKPNLFKLILVCEIGAFIMIGGYSLGRAFVYANVQVALLKLPYQILQAQVGVIVGIILYQKLKHLMH